MVIVKITCGMGNQMFMYAFARRLQEDTGQEICLDYSDFGDPEKNHNALFENTLQNFNICPCRVITNREEFLKITGEQGHQYYKMKRKLDFLLRYTTKIGRYYAEKWSQYKWNQKGFFWGRDDWIDVFPEVVETENIIVKGYWQSEKYFYHIANLIKEEFQVKTAIIPQNQDYLEMIRESEAVCVHVRRGDYVRGGQTFCSDRYYEKGMKFIREHIPNVRFFVFSDDIAYVKTMKIFYSDTVFIEGDNPPYEDLRLMCACKHFVISNSSFSWWAQYLSDSVNKVVVAPKPWRGKFTSDLVQNDWYTIMAQDNKARGDE